MNEKTQAILKADFAMVVESVERKEIEDEITGLQSATESFKRGWIQMLNGELRPIEELWDDINV